MTAALQTPYCFSFIRRGSRATSLKNESQSAVNSVVAAAAAVAQAEQQQQQQLQQQQQTAAATNNKEQPAAGAAATSTTAAGYESSIKTISTVRTVEEFWQTYDYLKRPNDLPAITDLHIFRTGIKPTWEDSANAKGGKWIARLPKGLASRYWEEIVLCIIGGQFSGIPDGEICGAVLSIRYNEDILALWNKTAHDREMVDRIRDCIKKVLQLPPYANMEYKPHQNSIADRSSFRNTQVWKPKSLEGRSVSHSTSGPVPSTATSSTTSSSAVTPTGTVGESRRQNAWTDRTAEGAIANNSTSIGGAAALKPKRDTSRGWR